MVRLARVIAVGVPHITRANESTRNNFIPYWSSPVWQFLDRLAPKHPVTFVLWLPLCSRKVRALGPGLVLTVGRRRMAHV
jgi:hypothetical protein